MNDLVGPTGLWGVALIMVVLVSWLFYRYFAPKSWREWAGAGSGAGLHYCAVRRDVWLSPHDLPASAFF